MSDFLARVRRWFRSPAPVRVPVTAPGVVAGHGHALRSAAAAVVSLQRQDAASERPGAPRYLERLDEARKALGPAVDTHVTRLRQRTADIVDDDEFGLVLKDSVEGA